MIFCKRVISHFSKNYRTIHITVLWSLDVKSLTTPRPTIELTFIGTIEIRFILQACGFTFFKKLRN